ncbi:helix-turn-helix transcriptional regulator [Streptomyces prasinus]|uniref:helix-turn-helix transcriptional regulator n=1 Tax=Streptomyces prasinus TaxID=67345 RepID=UPI00368224C1
MGLAERRKALGYSQERFAFEVGVDRTTVGRWERGTTTPEAVHRPRMAALLQLDLVELTELLARLRPDVQESAASSSGDRHGSEAFDDMIRRDFLRLVAVTGAITPLAPDEAEAMTEAAERSSAGDFHRMNEHLWQVFQLARSKQSVLGVVQDQLGSLNEAMKAGSSCRTDDLCTAVANVFQLVGELAFDGNRYGDAAAAYTVAASASGEARAFDLWACALVRHAYVDVYGKRFAEAVDLLDAAWKVAVRGDRHLPTRYWVASVQAEVYAGMGDVDSCERALEVAERVTDLPGPVHTSGWLRFDGERLPEGRGARYVQLGRLDLAESALERALKGDGLSKGMASRRRAAVLTDLALIGARRRDADQVLAFADEALQLARRSGSGYVAHRLQALQAELAPLGRNRRVAELGAEIGALHTT